MNGKEMGARLRERETAEFWSGVTVGGPDECWPWTRSTFGRRYGQWRWKGRQQGTHRIAYELSKGRKIPNGKLVRHTCDNSFCCNPAHLLVGTQADNMADAVERDRLARGERSPSAVLTDEKVAEIRRRRAAGELRVLVAAEFGISYTACFCLERGRTWSHVTDPPPGIFPNSPGHENQPAVYRKRRSTKTPGSRTPTLTSVGGR